MGSPAAFPMGDSRPFALAAQRDWLLARVATKRDITLRELLAELADRGAKAGIQPVQKYRPMGWIPAGRG